MPLYKNVVLIFLKVGPSTTNSLMVILKLVRLLFLILRMKEVELVFNGKKSMVFLRMQSMEVESIMIMI